MERLVNYEKMQVAPGSLERVLKLRREQLGLVQKQRRVSIATAQASVHLAEALIDLGEFHEAEALCTEAIQLATELGARVEVALGLATRFKVNMKLKGNRSGARENIQDALSALQILEETGNVQNTAYICGTLCGVFTAYDSQHALDYGQRAVKAARAIGPNTFEVLVFALANVSIARLDIMRSDGSLDALLIGGATALEDCPAFEGHREGLALARSVKNRGWEACLLLGMASELIKCGQHARGACDPLELRENATVASDTMLARAAEYGEQALDIFVELHDQMNEAETVCLLGRARFMLGEYATALSWLERAKLVFHATWVKLPTDRERIVYGDHELPTTFNTMLQMAHWNLGQREDALVAS